MLDLKGMQDVNLNACRDATFMTVMAGRTCEANGCGESRVQVLWVALAERGC